MKYLLENKLAPLTFNWGFLEAQVDAVKSAYLRWQKMILQRVKVKPIKAALAEALTLLEPLDQGSQRVLFLSTKGRWTACFDNGAQGGNPSTFVGELSQQMKCQGVACSCVPNTMMRDDPERHGTWGAVKFTLFAPGKREFLNIERRVSVTNDVRGWEFSTIGKAREFERLDRYETRKIVDRFTPEMLEEYCLALDINLFDENFYGGSGFITHSYPWFLPKLPTVTMAEARKKLGLSD